MKTSFTCLLFLSALYCSAQKFLETIKVTDSIYVFKPKIDWIHSNCTAIIGKDGIFIIDTFLQTNYAYEAIASLKRITPLPVKIVFNTHGHADHVMGNSVFKEIYPACTIIMNEATFAKYPRNFSYGGIKTFESDIPNLEKDLADGKIGGDYILTESLKTFWRWQIEESKAYVKVFKPISPANGDVTFSNTMTIHFGGHDILLMPMEGEGHDVGDAIAWLPREKVLMTGDIVVGPTPYAIRGRVNEMLVSLQRVIDMNPDVIVPGHGAVMKNLDYVKNEKELLTVIKQKSLEVIAQGISYEDAINGNKISIPQELVKRFTNGDDVKKWAMNAFFTNWAIKGTYQQSGALKKN